jgi:hypothetical protein
MSRIDAARPEAAKNTVPVRRTSTPGSAASAAFHLAEHEHARASSVAGEEVAVLQPHRARARNERCHPAAEEAERVLRERQAGGAAHWRDELVQRAVAHPPAT